MASLPGIIGLVLFLYIRPQELFEPLKDFNFLYVCLFLAVAGMGYDISRKRTVLMSTPHLRYVVMFSLWCIVTLALRKPSEVSTRATAILVCLTLYAVMATGIQSIQAFQ